MINRLELQQRRRVRPSPESGLPGVGRGVIRRVMSGANVGKNRDTMDGAADYVAGIETVAGLADYLVLNISSPNTPGLRALQARGAHRGFASARADCPQPRRAGPKKRRRCWPKSGRTSPERIARYRRGGARASGIDGLIVGNTTIERPSWLKSREQKRGRRPIQGAPDGSRPPRCLAAALSS